ncbi:MAG: DUF1858 domain-containing protein [Planctomycetota bacterium]|nr:DUF1858 domain-containing protein [Planctomycetota bacterium]
MAAPGEVGRIAVGTGRRVSYHPGMLPTKDTIIADLLDLHADVAKVLLSFGLPCHECVVAPVETLEQGASLTGLDADEILAKLRELPIVAGKAGPPSDSKS